ATQRFIRQARVQGAASGLIGPYALLAEVGLSWLQARLVLHLAAAYGHDPADPARAAELLVLQRVYGSVAMAGEALHRSPNGSTPTISGLAAPVGGAALLLGLVRAASRVVPGGGAVVGALTGARSTERLATRAIRYYRQLKH